MRAEIIILISVILSIISNVDSEAKDIESKCAVVDGVRNFTFNLNSLISELGYHVRASDYGSAGQYRFNICKQLSRKCNNQTAAACFVKDSKTEIVIGYNGSVIWTDGQITINYEGEKCDDNQNYKTNVILHCDYNELKNDFLGVFPHHDQCNINIVMRTPQACPPLPENVKNAKLYVKTPTNKILNFKSLQSSNHEVVDGRDFHIGFPILYGHNMMCEAGTSICYVNPNESDPLKKYLNMGSMTSDLKYTKERGAYLQLTSNEICENDKKYKSEIIFECDPLISGDGVPSFKGTSNCTHRFVWQTSHACIENEKPCQLTTSDGQFYDFSSLRAIQYKANHPNNTFKAIHFSICSPADSPCEGDVGSCIVLWKDANSRQITNAGYFNSTLQIDSSKNIYLLYENGAKCNADGRKFSTKIEFVVADNEDDEVSVLVEDDCEIVVQVKTLLANANVKNCIAKTLDDEEIDLSALIDYEGNYIASVNEKTLPNEAKENIQYLMNVCRPLNSKYSLNCVGNTAACRTVIKDDKHEEELSLGHFEYSMSTEKRKDDNTTAVIMKYFKGSICPIDTTENIITKVAFFCNETVGLGNPILQSIEHCEYAFDFPTNILCRDRVIRMKDDDESSCELFNEILNVSVDLKKIGIFSSEEIPMKKIDICDRKVMKRYTINYRQSMILIQYDKASNQDYRKVEVQLKCGNNKTMMVVTADEILVTSESMLVCPLLNIKPKMTTPILKAPKLDNDVIEPVASSGFSIGYLFLIIILIFAFVAFYLVLRNPERREIIRNMIKFRSRSRNVRYSRVQQDEERVLLDNHVASDSDDDVILA